MTILAAALAAVIVTSCLREALLPEPIAIAASSARSASIQPAPRRPRPVSLDQRLGVFAGLIG